MEEKQQLGMMELIDEVIASLQVIKGKDYDWIRKYANTYLSVSKDWLDRAMKINELQINHNENDE